MTTFLQAGDLRAMMHQAGLAAQGPPYLNDAFTDAEWNEILLFVKCSDPAPVLMEMPYDCPGGTCAEYEIGLALIDELDMARWYEHPCVYPELYLPHVEAGRSCGIGEEKLGDLMWNVQSPEEFEEAVAEECKLRRRWLGTALLVGGTLAVAGVAYGVERRRR